MDVQVAKAQRQFTLLLRGNQLFAQEHHLVAKHRVIQLFKLVIAQRTGQVRAGNLCTDIRP